MVRIALLQARGVPADVSANLDEMNARAGEAAAAGAELLVFPELFLTGSHIGEERMTALAEPSSGPAFQRAAAIARDRSIGLLYGYAERQGDTLFNAARLIDADGTPIANYRKTHLFDKWERSTFQAGTALEPVDFGGVRLGILICYDVEFPEPSRVLAVRGAEVIVVPTALKASWPDLPGRLIPTRALENLVHIVYANRCGEENGLAYAGRSLVAAPDGSVLASAGEGEALLCADLRPERFADARARTPYLSDRRPALYGALAATVAPKPGT